MPIEVGEYGAGASIYQSEENPLRLNPGGGWHPGKWLAKLYEAYWLQIKHCPWLWRSFVWCRFDFASTRRSEGDTAGHNDKGLVTVNEQMRKSTLPDAPTPATESNLRHAGQPIDFAIREAFDYK